MENKAKKENKGDLLYSLQIAGVVAAALLLAVPVFLYMAKANNIGGAISQERLESFVSSTAEIKAPSRPARLPSGAPASGITLGSKYDNAGSAILSVSPQNIASLTADDFHMIGETPFSLMNTVAGNQAVPSVVAVVFDNRQVVSAFLTRPTTQELLNNPQKLADMIKSNDYIIERFFASPAVAQTLNNESVMLAVNNSVLFSNILQSKTGQYFIKNPRAARQLVNDNKTLAPLLQNESLRKFAEINPQTRAAAAAFYQ
ncbi:MAG: hypothetical protein LBL61_01985 [Elusimicrobiota bacterium]|jgi:hypothetical protein|nr:hypothetical protein [Elusimicrobiota bacterium]